MLVFLMLFSLFGLVYIYGGFSWLLKTIYIWNVWFKNIKRTVDNHPTMAYFPSVSVYFSAYNEESNIRKRLENLISLSYPSEKMEIIILSDGSNDHTVELAKKFASENPNRDIKVIEYLDNQGQARAQNEVVLLSKYDILVSTDAETFFPKDLLEKLLAPFTDPLVGVVGAVVNYQSESSGIGDSYTKYRNMEFQMRKYESLLGVGVKTDGPCLAYRKSFWEDIQPWEDVDQVISLFARKNGYITVQADNAVCYDRANKTPRQEIKQRSRMTKKALLSTFGRWKLNDIVQYPTFSFVLFSHKIVRFFSPFFLLLLILSSIGWLYSTSLLFHLPFLIFSAICMLSIFVFRKTMYINKMLKSLYSFFLANLGFLIGCVQWLKGDRLGNYRPTRSL